MANREACCGSYQIFSWPAKTLDPCNVSTMRLFKLNHCFGGSLKIFRFTATSSLAAALLVTSFHTPVALGEKIKADEQTFFKLQHDWAEARKSADMRFLENFYAKEFTVGSMNGGESSRTQDLAMFSSGDLKPAVIEDKEM